VSTFLVRLIHDEGSSVVSTYKRPTFARAAALYASVMRRVLQLCGWLHSPASLFCVQCVLLFALHYLIANQLSMHVSTCCILLSLLVAFIHNHSFLCIHFDDYSLCSMCVPFSYLAGGVVHYICKWVRCAVFYSTRLCLCRVDVSRFHAR